MAINTLLSCVTEVGDRLNLDMTVTSNKTKGIRWANIIQNDMAGRYPFQWLFTNGFIQTVTDYTTGTITGTLGSTTLTGSGTAWTSAYLNAYIQPANDTNWYEVTAVGSTTSMTITPGLAAAVTAGTYTLRTTYYDLPANCYQVFDVRQTNTPLKLTRLGIYTLDQYQPDINTTSNPTGYFLFGEDPLIASTAAKQTLIGFFPCPDAKYNIQLRYMMNLTDLAADGDTPLIPVDYTNVLLDGMEWLGCKFINDPKESEKKQSYEFGIEKMIEAESRFGDYFPILQTSDAQANVNRFLPFPSNFEQPSNTDY